MIILNLSFVKLASVTFQTTDGPLVVYQYTNIVNIRTRNLTTHRKER